MSGAALSRFVVVRVAEQPCRLKRDGDDSCTSTRVGALPIAEWCAPCLIRHLQKADGSRLLAFFGHGIRRLPRRPRRVA